jgi:hypothetical protein
VSGTIEEILAVAGNRPVFVSILEARKAIAFVGAGASAGLRGAPDIDESNREEIVPSESPAPDNATSTSRPSAIRL